MQITADQLALIYKNALRANIDKFIYPLNAAMTQYGIATPAVIAAFLAQIGHESGQLRWVEELASGAAYDTGKLAEKLGNSTEKDGDGQRYKGRGLIQITGKYNYKLASKALGYDFVKEPQKLSLPEYATKSAAWFWADRKLNQLAERGDFYGITKRINGGLNGIDDRLEIWNRAKKVLNVKS